MDGRVDLYNLSCGGRRKAQQKYQAKNKGLPLDIARRMLYTAKNRAKKKGLEFDLKPEDLFFPTFCPVLGIRLTLNDGAPADSSPTLDRIDNTKGYVKGNVAVISHKANTMKGCGTAEEHEKIVAWMRG